MLQQKIQTALQLIYPPSCICCGGLVGEDFALCGACWRDTPFIGGLVCDICGVPLMGDDGVDHENHAACDTCMRVARPWSKGRSAMVYRDNGRKLVLSLKHGDRQEVARAAGVWLARAARPIVAKDTIVVPVPLHWSRMLKRRFNQSALLAQSVARAMGLQCIPDLLQRHRRTKSLGGLGHDERFQTVADTMRVHAKYAEVIAGRSLLLVDDVMTSGATLAAATEALQMSRPSDVCVVTLARVAKDD